MPAQNATFAANVGVGCILNHESQTFFSMKCCFALPIYLFLLLFPTGMIARACQQTEPDSIPPASGKPSDWDVAVEAVQLSADARLFRDSFAQKAERLTAQREILERAVQKAQADTTTAVEQLKTMKNELREAQKEEKEVEKNLKRAKTTAEFAELVANMEARQQRAQLPKSRKQVQQIKNILYPPEPAPEKEKGAKDKPEEPPVVVAAETPVVIAETPAKADSSAATQNPVGANEKKRGKAKTAQQPPKTVFKTYSSAEDVMINPPTPPCVLASNIRDEFSGEVRREMQRTELFRHTNQALRKIYTDKAHTIGEASLLSIGLNAALRLNLRVNDPNVRRTQGSLQKGGVAILRFMDGSTVTLYNQRSDDGEIVPEGEAVNFEAQFPLDRTLLKKIRNTELDKIRLAWTNGYEDYDVQQVDVLMRQAKCLFE